jgi:hypothetical protein
MEVFSLRRRRFAFILAANGALLISCQLVRAQKTEGRGTAFEKAYTTLKEKSPDAATTLLAAMLLADQGPANPPADQGKETARLRNLVVQEADTALALQLIALQDTLSRRAAADALAELAGDRKELASRIVADFDASGRLGTTDDHADAANAARVRLSGDIDAAWSGAKGESLEEVDSARARVHVPAHKKGVDDRDRGMTFKQEYEAAKKVSPEAAADLLAAQALLSEKASQFDAGQFVLARAQAGKPLNGDEPELAGLVKLHLMP